MTKSRFSIAVIVLGSVLIGGSAVAARETTNAAAVPNKLAKPALEQGMETDAVIRIVGKPRTVRPMKSPEGNAEVWTYLRELGVEVIQTPTMVEQVPAFVGIGVDGPSRIQTRTQEIYSLQHVTTYQVTELLMFDGKLVNAKQWREKRRSFE